MVLLVGAKMLVFMALLIASSNPVYAQKLLRSLKAHVQEEVRLIEKKEELNAELLDELQPRYIFFPHWSSIIPASVFEKYNCIVFHMSDLPYGRGGSPLQNLIVRGHKNTVIAAIKVVKELDAGPVYLKVPLSLEGSAREIFERCVPLVEQMMLKIIDEKLQPQAQTGEVVEFKRRAPKDGNLADLIRLEQVYDFIRMLDADGYPAAFIESEKIKFEFTSVQKNADNTLSAHVRISEK